MTFWRRVVHLWRFDLQRFRVVQADHPADDDRPPPLPTRLYIVESRPAGELRPTITARDCP